MDQAFIKREEGTWLWREKRDDGTPTVVKMYRKRGRLTVLRERLFGFRAEREYHRLQHLVRSGIPCTEPVAWSCGKNRDHGRYEVLVTREIPDTVDLASYLKEHPDADLAPLFSIVRQMHESGFCHQTLYGRNILVDGKNPAHPNYFILDVPRSWIYPFSIAHTSMAMYDLLDLVHEIERAGVTPDEEARAAYGLDDRGRQWWSEHEAVDSTTKFRRRVRDMTARISWMTAWVLYFATEILPFGMF